MTKADLLKLATKSLTVNKQIAKLASNKTMIRKLNTNLKEGDVFWLRESVRVLDHSDLDEYFEMTYQFEDGKIETLNSKDITNNLILKDYEFENKYLCKRWIEQCQKVPRGCTKEMARHFYKVISVHEERLQDITIDDILDEGCPLFTTQEEEYKSHNLKIAKGTRYFCGSAVKKWWIKTWNSTAKAPHRWEDEDVMVQVIEFEEIHYD